MKCGSLAVAVAAAILTGCGEQKQPEQFAGVSVESSVAELEKAGFACRAVEKNTKTECVRFDGNPTYIGYPVQSFTIKFDEGSKTPTVFLVTLPEALAAGAPIGRTAEVLDKLNAQHTEDPKGINSDNPALFMKGWRAKHGAEVRLTVFKGIPNAMLPSVTVSFFPVNSNNEGSRGG